MIYVLSIMVFASIVALAWTISSQGSNEVLTRLKQIGLGTKEDAISPEEAELAKPFTERVYKPMVEKVAAIVAKYTPSGFKSGIKAKLVSAGNPRGMQVNDFLAMKGFAAIGFAGVLAIIFILTKQPIGKTLFICGITFAFGFFYPDLWISSQIKNRQKIIQKALPDVLDLLCVSVEAGLGFDSALAKVVEKIKGPLADEFNKTLQEVRMNKPRRDALRDLAARVNLEDLTSFIAALIQADQLGVSIAKVLRIQSEQMRVRRRQRAEEQAQKASLKMLFPLIFCIFPSMFIVLLGPVLLSIKDSLGK